MEYSRIDENAVFLNLDQFYLFDFLDRDNKLSDKTETKINFLITNVYDNIEDFEDLTCDEKVKTVESNAKESGDWNLILFVEFIRTNNIRLSELNENVEDEVLYKRLINIECGVVNDFSITQEIKRIERCIELENEIENEIDEDEWER